jgi:hypothetical protein
MKVNWNELKSEDFAIENPSWAPSRPTTDVIVGGEVVRLGISKRIEITVSIVDVFKDAIGKWESEKEVIATMTEEYLQTFLPGKRIDPDELVLWNIKLNLDDSPARNPQSVVFLYTVGGSYSEPGFDLVQFNHESSVELMLRITNGAISLDKCSFDIVNDF